VAKVRIGVIGVGGMGQGHCEAVKQVEAAELTAVCDIDRKTADMVAAKYGVPAFYNHKDLLKSGLVDAITIATPHYDHPPIAIDAFRRGLHVLSEKPIAVTVKEADRMIAAAKKSGKVFEVCYQMRCDPKYRAAKALMEKGHVGELVRVNMLIADYRSQAYYDSGGWRATWAGEGGGVLFNQAPHMMDIFCWLVGLPKTVTAQTRTRLHNIEVEDEASASMEFANGASGYLYASTTEVPRTYRFEVVGDKGKILLDEKGLRYWKLETPISTFTRTSKEMWGGPKSQMREIAGTELDKLVGAQAKEADPTHRGIVRNFCDAIQKGRKRLVPGEECGMQVELADAITLSSKRGKTVKLPLKRKEYEDLMAELIAGSKPKTKVKEQRVTDTVHVKALRKKKTK
jgi:predicted dehydrogenase